MVRRLLFISLFLIDQIEPQYVVTIERQQITIFLILNTGKTVIIVFFIYTFLHGHNELVAVGESQITP